MKKCDESVHRLSDERVNKRYRVRRETDRKNDSDKKNERERGREQNCKT